MVVGVYRPRPAARIRQPRRLGQRLHNIRQPRDGKKIQQALLTLMKDRTSFVIAQRIGTVRNADVILLLDNSKLVAQGTHDELLQSNELYAEILETQFGDRAELISMVEKELSL